MNADLNEVGVPSEAATAVSDGATLRGKDAGKFVSDNKNVLNLTLLQQQSLFNLVISTYINLVRMTVPKSLLSRLFQHEFEGMLSLAWNLRRYGHYSFNGDITRLDMVRSDPSIRTLTRGERGIPGRRVRETSLFTDATYVIKPLTLRDIDIEFYDDVPLEATRRG